ERGPVNPACARIFKDDVIEFDVPEAGSKAAAEVIRRCVDRTNPEAAKRQAARQRLGEAQQRQGDDEGKRVKDKYRDGLLSRRRGQGECFSDGHGSMSRFRRASSISKRPP